MKLSDCSPPVIQFNYINHANKIRLLPYLLIGNLVRINYAKSSLIPLRLIKK